MDYNNEQPFYYKTWVIVLAFIVCWPVGIALLVLRINSSKKTMFDGSKTIKICYGVGAVLILIGLSTFSNKHILSGLFYIAGGAALIYFGIQNKKKVERYKGYIELVANQKVYSIDTIANTMNVTYDLAKEEIGKLISKGSFRGATINELTRSIDIVQVQQPIHMQPSMQAMAQNMINGYMEAAPAAAVNVTATCPGCGGTMAAQKGATVECDYCGKIFTAN